MADQVVTDQVVFKCNEACPVIKRENAVEGAILPFDLIPDNTGTPAYRIANKRAAEAGNFKRKGLCTEWDFNGYKGESGWCYLRRKEGKG